MKILLDLFQSPTPAFFVFLFITLYYVWAKMTGSGTVSPAGLIRFFKKPCEAQPTPCSRRLNECESAGLKIILLRLLCNLLLFSSSQCSASQSWSLTDWMTNFFASKQSQAVQAYKSQDYEQGLAHCHDLMNDDPYNPEHNYNVGNLLYRQKKYSDAQQAFARTVEHVKSSSKLVEQAAFNLGNSCYQLEQWQDAVTAYQQVLKINEHNEPARHNLQLALQKLSSCAKTSADKQPKQDEKSQDDKNNSQDKKSGQSQDQDTQSGGDDEQQGDDSGSDDGKASTGTPADKQGKGMPQNKPGDQPDSAKASADTADGHENNDGQQDDGDGDADKPSDAGKSKGKGQNKNQDKQSQQTSAEKNQDGQQKSDSQSKGQGDEQDSQNGADEHGAGDSQDQGDEFDMNESGGKDSDKESSKNSLQSSGHDQGNQDDASQQFDQTQGPDYAHGAEDIQDGRDEQHGDNQDSVADDKKGARAIAKKPELKNQLQDQYESKACEDERLTDYHKDVMKTLEELEEKVQKHIIKNKVAQQGVGQNGKNSW